MKQEGQAGQESDQEWVHGGSITSGRACAKVRGCSGQGRSSAVSFPPSEFFAKTVEGSMKKVLLTGAAGGVGGIFRAFAAGRYGLVCMDKMPTPGVPGSLVGELDDPKAL